MAVLFFEYDKLLEIEREIHYVFSKAFFSLRFF
jgi:hypothetical protein